MEKINFTIFAIFIFFTSLVYAQPEVEIPHAKPGSCYTKCLIADEYTTETEQIELKAASVKVEIIPAEYASVSEQVLVRAAATRIERIPAEYETQTHSFVKGCPSGYEPEGGHLVAGSNCIRFISVPAEYETATEQVLVKEASTRLEIVPPTYETVTEQILIKAAYFPDVIIPAQYETVTEQVLVSEATVRIERKPARYKSQSEQIEIAPVGTKWVKKRADQNCLSADPADCLIWCHIETPPAYQTIIKKVRVGCDDSWTIKGDDCLREVEIPAEYSTRTYRVLKTGTSHARPREIPAEYTSVTRRILVKKGGFTEWREVIACGGPIPKTVQRIQDVLRSRGYYPGPSNNKMGPETKAALIQFQKDNDLPVGNLDVKTMKALGVNY